MRRWVHVVAVLLLSLTLGLHWLVLQSVAWTTMLMERSQAASFSAALKSTFDGHHPCKLCRVVQEGRGQEKAPEAPLKLPKLELASLSESGIDLDLPTRSDVVSVSPLGELVRTERPPLPPPRWS